MLTEKNEQLFSQRTGNSRLNESTPAHIATKQNSFQSVAIERFRYEMCNKKYLTKNFFRKMVLKNY